MSLSFSQFLMTILVFERGFLPLNNDHDFDDEAETLMKQNDDGDHQERRPLSDSIPCLVMRVSSQSRHEIARLLRKSLHFVN
jgi:hypothetical protein